MQLNKFDLNLLIALDALLQEKNVTRAAERVFVSQPAMSAALQRLRDYFTDPLLIRVGRDMELTPRGLSLVEPVRNALLQIQATLGTQATFDPEVVERAFTLTVADHIVPQLLPGLARRVIADAPGVRLAIDDLSQASLSRLEYGDSDLCVMLDAPQTFGLRAYPEWCRQVELMPVRWVCVLCRDHPYVGDELTVEHWETLPHVMTRPAGTTADPVDRPWRGKLPDVEARVTAPGFQDLPFLLPGTTLVAMVPESVSLRLAGVLPIRALRPPADIPDCREILLWHKRNEADPGHAWLRDLVAEIHRHGG